MDTQQRIVKDDIRERKRISDLNADRMKSLNFLRTPTEWPLWPRLPLKRTQQPYVDMGMPQLGIVIEDPAKEQADVTVHLCNMHDPYEVFKDAETIVYTDLAAMVADGWRVG